MSKDSTVEAVELLDFYADWCAPCQIVNPILEELASEFKERIRLVKVNVDVDSALVEKYEVYSIPTLVFVRNGSEINRIVGAKGKQRYHSTILESLKPR